MHKLIQAFIAKPTTENARKLVAYLNKHPMAEVTAGMVDRDMIAKARASLSKMEG